MAETEKPKVVKTVTTPKAAKEKPKKVVKVIKNKAPKCCNGCLTPNCRNIQFRPENIRKCAALHGLILSE